MPDHGRLTHERLPHAAPAISPLYPPPPWPLPGASVLKLLFETDVEPVLQWLPPRLSRSSPPYAIITVASYPESPVGRFALASQHIGCRAGFFIRALTLQAIADNPVAMTALREVWGFPCKLGDVSLVTAEDGVSATVSRAGVTLVEASLDVPEPIDPASVRFDPELNIRCAPGLETGRRHDLLQLVQIDPEIQVRQAVRGHGRLTFTTPSEADPWHHLPVRNMVAAVHCLIDTEMPLARFVMPY